MENSEVGGSSQGALSTLLAFFILWKYSDFDWYSSLVKGTAFAPKLLGHFFFFTKPLDLITCVTQLLGHRCVPYNLLWDIVNLAKTEHFCSTMAPKWHNLNVSMWRILIHSPVKLFVQENLSFILALKYDKFSCFYLTSKLLAFYLYLYLYL